MSKGSPTQLEIARKAGVSVMTVSVALRGKPGVSAEKAAEIVAIAKELGYRPNPLVMSLMRCRSSRRKPDTGLTIGWYGPMTALRTRERSRSIHDVFKEYARGASAACKLRGFRIENIGNHRDYLDEKRIIQIIRARGIRGLILGPKSPKEAALQFPKPIPFDIVQLGRSRHDATHDRVISDIFSAMRSCVHALQRVGCRRVGYVDQAEHQKRSEDRVLAAFLVSSVEGACPAGLNGSDLKAQDFLSDYLKKHKPDGLIVASNSMTREVIRTRPVPFVCLHAENQKKWVTGPTTDHYGIGKAAATILMDRILGPQHEAALPYSHVLATGWREGTSHLKK